MFLRRAGRLSAAALGRPGSFVVRLGASGPGRVALTARAGLPARPHRFLCASAGGADLSRAHLGRRRRGADPAQNWVTPPLGFVTAERGRSAAVDRVGRHNGGGNTEVVLFTGNWGVCSRHRSSTSTTTSTSTSTMQIRASSTSAAAKKSEEQADSSKVEASTTSTSEKGLEDTPEPTPEPGGGKLNKTQQLKKVFKEYGAVGVSFHIGISLMSLGMFYLLISSGIDMAAMLCKLGFSETVVQSKMAAGTSTFVLAYAIHKLFAPVRISITLVSVPLIVRYFRKTGLFKPPTPAP